MITVDNIEKKEMAELIAEAKNDNNLIVKAMVICTLIICKFLASMRSNQLLTEAEKVAIREKQMVERTKR